MTQEFLNSALTRRQIVTLAAAGLAAGLLPLHGRASESEGGSSGGSGGSFALAPTGLAGKRVVVVGGAWPA